MAAGRSLKSLVSRRRRGDEEGEDDEGPVMVEDSQSEGSGQSDLEDDDEADASSMAQSSAVGGGADPAEGETKAAAKKKTRKRPGKKQSKEPTLPVEFSQQQSQPAFKPAPDTEAMLNGLPVGDQVVQEVVDFESAGRDANGNAAPVTSAPVIVSTDRKSDSPASRQRKEHEEYRRKRDADPFFVPNRGNFFMHDTRANHGQGNLPIRGAWTGRGRGRGGGGNVSGPFTPINQMAQQEKVAEGPWKHDLHDTINEEPTASKSSELPHDQIDSARLFPNPGGASQNNHNGPHAKLSFSNTTLVGKVQIRVLLPGMKAPITFSEVPWKQYTRLPDHRPPLRRDKPVRISIPEHVQRYIFPSSQRSFIFIPRQMRPNQRGYGNDRYQRSIGGMGYTSRRTSMYGGSVYAGSIAASRRSSFASIARETAFSPVGSYVGMPSNRPVVRLPHGMQSHFSASSAPMGPLSGHQTPTGMHMHTFPPPAQPYHQGTPTTTVHQPRPQKVISVTGIESPALLSQAQSELQPFANQLPAHMHEHRTLPPPYFSPRQQFSFPQQQSGTPLSGIPEQAMHAPAFQAMLPYPQGPYYAPYPSQQQGYYYPPGPNGYNPMAMYMPPQQNYMLSPPSAPPLPPPQSPPQQRPSQPAESEETSAPSGMVAHESNGMVFYLPAAEAPAQAQGENYQPAESFVPAYAMPGLPPPTPAPESTYYYPPPQMSGFYSAQGQQ